MFVVVTWMGLGPVAVFAAAQTVEATGRRLRRLVDATLHGADPDDVFVPVAC